MYSCAVVNDYYYYSKNCFATVIVCSVWNFCCHILFHSFSPIGYYLGYAPPPLSLSVWFLCYVITVLPTHMPVATATAEGVMGELVRIIFSCKHFMFPCKSVVTIVIITGGVVHGNGAH